jgi:hypothetical protein
LLDETMTTTSNTSELIGTAWTDLEQLIAWVQPHAQRLDAMLDHYAEKRADKTRTLIKKDLHALITRAAMHHARFGALKDIDANAIDHAPARKWLKAYQRAKHLVEGRLQELFKRCVGLQVLGAEEWRDAEVLMRDAGVDVHMDYRMPHYLTSLREAVRAVDVLLRG